MAKRSKRSRKKTSDKGGFISIDPKWYKWIVLVIFFILVFALFRETAFLNQTFSSGDSIGGASIQKFAIEELRENNRYILWSPYVFSGMPTYGSIIFNFAYPFMFLWSFILPSFLTKIIKIHYVHLILAGFWMYLLLRHLKLKRIAAVLGGLAFMLTPHLVGLLTIAHGGKVWTASYMPLVLLVIIKLFKKRNLFNLALAGLVLGLQLLAQHPQIVYYTYMLVGFYFLYDGVWSYVKDKDLKAIGSKFLFLFLALAIGFAIAAIYYIPVYQYSRYSMRGAASAVSEEPGVGFTKSGLDYDYATKWSFPPEEIITFFAPFYYGISLDSEKVASYWGEMPFTQTTLYMGLLPLLLAILAAVIYRKNKLITFLITVWILALLLSFGRHFAPLSKFMLAYFPFYNKFRVPATLHILIEFSTAILAAFGVNYLLSMKREKKSSGKRKSELTQTPVASRLSKVAIGIGIFAFVVLVVFLLGGNGLYKAMSGSAFYREQDVQMIERSAPQNWSPQDRANYLEQMKMQRFNVARRDFIKMSIFLIAIAALIFLWTKKLIPKTAFIIGVLAILFLDLWIVDRTFTETAHERVSITNTFPENESVKFLRAQEENDLFRILPSPAANLFQDNRWAYYRFQSLGGYSAAKLRHYDDFIQYVLFEQGLNQQAIDMMNAKYFVETRLLRMPPNYQLVHNGSYKIYENKSALPRAWIVNKLKMVESGKGAIDELNSPEFDPRQYAILEETPDFSVGSEDTLGLVSIGEKDSSAVVEVKEFDYHKVSFQTQSNSDGFLVVSEVWYPADWNVYIDGEKVDYYKTNFVIRGLFLPKGEHTVEFVLDAGIYNTSLAISLGALILVLGVIITNVILEKKKKE